MLSEGTLWQTTTKVIFFRVVFPVAVDASITSTVRILGVPISVTDMKAAVDTIGRWVRCKESRYVCACDVHSVMRAQENELHMRALRSANMVVPDGTPLVWVGQLRGKSQMQRVSGPDLLCAVCERSVQEGWRHYFFGGEPGVAELLAKKLVQKFPGIVIAGTDCPPFRELTKTELDESIQRMQEAKPDIIWVGLGCPKQEIWMDEHHARLRGMTLVGVGAAFDFESGRVKRAPLWLRSYGMEWLHRLISEPRRLWRRYLVLAPRFILTVLIEQLYPFRQISR